MELRHLKYFVSVAEERNFNRAAARLRVSQPAVSRQIADLEEELGVHLFARNGHGVELTSEGEIMLAHARTVLRAASDAKESMRVFQKHSTETLVVGYVPAEMGGMLTSALRRLEVLFPNVEVNLLEMSPHDHVKALLSRALDVVFVGSPWKRLEEQVSIQVLQKQTVHVVVADHHRLALRKQVALAELSEETFVGFCDKTFPGRNDAIISACRAVGFTPNIRHLAAGLSAAFALVAAGKGLTLAPGEVTQLPQAQTVFLKLEPAVPLLTSVAALRKDEERASIKKLIELCKEQTEPGNVREDVHSAVARRAVNPSPLGVVRLPFPQPQL
jgi:DNA-binding transcriptional LysR family regulator